MTESKFLAKILTIDDEDVLRESLACYLEDSGFEVLEAENGKVGMEKIEKYKPDLVLCDLQMPVMTGREVLEEMNKHYKDIPVVVVSGAGNMSDAIAALRLGAADYLVKPITDMTILEHTVNRCLENSKLKKQIIVQQNQIQKQLQELKDDQEAGRIVQEKMQPISEFQVDNFKLSYKVNPAIYLSGDFIDYFEIDEDHFGFYIADVSGHGAASAFVTVMIRNFILKIRDKHKLSPSEDILVPDKLLKLISDEVHKAKLGKYLTMVYGVIHRKNKTFSYSIGGHYPNPILFDGQKATFLDGKGFAVGIFDKATFSTQTIPLPEKFTLAMLSDGVLEIIEKSDLKEKEAELLKLISEPNLTLESLIQSLKLEGDKLKALPDDVTMLILKNQ